MADPEGVPDVEQAPEATTDEPTSEEPSSQGDDAGQPAQLASQLMRDPMMLAALQDKLGSMVGANSGYIQSLPKSVKRRLKALKKLQFEATKIEAEFYREVHRLECEYAVKYAPLVDKRTHIVTGDYEPNEEEAEWPSDDEKEDELANGKKELSAGDSKDEVKNKATIEDKPQEEKKEDEETKGIPGFWLTIFKNVDMLSEMIQPHDEPILSHLYDITVKFTEKDPMGFTLEFFFNSNEYFENKKLTKEYIMRSEPEEGDPFSFEGPEIIKCNGCKIDWKKGKNVTVKTVKKKQKHKASGTTRTIQKTVQSDSFFNFFSPPSPPDDEEMDEDTEALLAADFEIGHFIRERIVPRAVLYFTGEALENEDDDEYGEEEEGGEEGEYDEDADPDYNPEMGKYITREFQERCAQLALGRMSTPSSAPCDTRLRLRPNSGSAIRQDMHVQTDISSRPQTAPLRSPHVQSHDIQSVVRKPEVKTGAFIEHDVERPKTVFGDQSEQRNSPQKSLVREGTEIVLPNSLTPEDVVEGRVDKGGKMSREKTIVNKASEYTVKSQPGKSPRRLSRERTFLQSPRRKMLKNPGRQFKNKRGHETLDSVEEFSDSDVEHIIETQYLKTVKADVANKGGVNSAGAIEKNKLFSKGNSRNEQETIETKRAGERVKAPPNESVEGKGKIGQPGIKQSRYGSVRSAGSYNRKDTESKQSTKEAAFSILQKLTGKNPDGHRPGHVPNVNKPKRKYKFENNEKSTDSRKPRESNVAGKLSDKRVEIDSESKTIKDELVEVRDFKNIRNREPVSRKNREKNAIAMGDKLVIEEMQEKSPVNEPRKLGSAPVFSRKQAISTSGKFPVYETKDVVCKPKQINSRQSRSAQPRLKNQFTEEENVEADVTTIAKSGLRSNESVKIEKGRQLDIGNGSKSQETVGKSKKNVREQIVREEFGQPKPGVRIQNAMISTSIEVSESFLEGEAEDGRISVARSSTPKNIHPKFEDSPYLRESVLLQSGRHRRRQAASSAHSLDRSSDHGASGLSSGTKSTEQS